MNSCCEPLICSPRLLSQGFVYYFISGTINADPGTGFLTYNNIVQADATQIYIDFETATLANIQNYLQNISISMNSILGQVYILRADNSGRGQVFNVTAVTIYSNYAALTVTLIDELNGPNALTFGDGVIFSFVQAGDAGGPQGFQGASGPQGFQGTAGSAGGSTSPNNLTNNTFVGSGQIPALAGAMAANGQTATCTFGTYAMIFVITVGNQYLLCGTSYASSLISSIDDPGNLFGVGIVVTKSSNSYVVSFHNQIGSTVEITVQAINSPITSATVWS